MRDFTIAAAVALALLAPAARAQSEFFDCPVARAMGEDPLIDDLEDGDLSLLEVDGRRGIWYSFDDGTDGEQALVAVPVVEAPSGGKSALYIAGSGWTGWGAGFGVCLNVHPQDESFCFYDASIYSGIQFWIRARGFAETRLYAQTPPIVPIAEGGECDPSVKGCWNSHSSPFAVSEEWTFVRIPFSELVQENPPVDGSFDPRQIRAIDFAAPAFGEYEVWIDDLAFYVE